MFEFPNFLRKKYAFSGWLVIVLIIQYLLTSNTEPELRDNKIPRKPLEPAVRRARSNVCPHQEKYVSMY